jgi:hypothetical protein
MTATPSSRVVPPVRRGRNLRMHTTGRGATWTLTVVALVVITALCWWRTIDDAHGMDSMVQGLAQAGSGMPFDMNMLTFVGM